MEKIPTPWLTLVVRWGENDKGFIYISPLTGARE